MGCQESYGLGEDGVEALDGSEGYQVGAGEAGAGGYGAGSIGDYIDIRKCKCAGRFAEEGGLLVIRFDQRQMDVRGPDFQGKGGEPGAGADVEEWAVAGGRWSVPSTQYPVEAPALRPTHRNVRDDGAPPHWRGRGGGLGRRIRRSGELRFLLRLRMAVRLMRAFQRSNRSMYVDI